MTLYPDGRSFIPRHSDDEPSIEPDSLIYTVSVGAQRVISFLNSDCLLHEAEVALPHGSVFTMSSSSQAVWSHAIDPDPSTSEARVSFTFRRLVAEPMSSPRKRVPPIQPPQPVLPSIARGTHKRILLLTDSVLMPLPVHIFNKLGDYRCIKKKNFELIDVFNFEHEFKYSDIVIFSCGVNDLARYGKHAHVLADMITRRLSECLERNRGTTFIFNSNLSTAHGWLNSAIEQFSHIMFRLSLEHPNFLYFDSHAVLKRHHISSPDSQIPVIKPGDDGIHITREAMWIVADQLANAVDFVAHLRTGRDPAVSPRLIILKLLH